MPVLVVPAVLTFVFVTVALPRVAMAAMPPLFAPGGGTPGLGMTTFPCVVRASIAEELLPVVLTGPVLATVAPVALLAKMPPELVAPEVTMLPLVTETAPALEAA